MASNALCKSAGERNNMYKHLFYGHNERSGYPHIVCIYSYKSYYREVIAEYLIADSKNSYIWLSSSEVKGFEIFA